MDPIESPLISVIMPAYNTEKYIGEAIESILNQTYSRFELLICDDGSTDQTYEIAQHFASVDPRIKVFRNKRNIGNLKTTNFLFDQCKGEFIAVQDSDDVSDKDRFQMQFDYLYENPTVSLLGTNFVSTNSFLDPISSSNLPLENEDITRNLHKEVPPILYGSIMFKKKILNTIGNFRLIFNRKGFADLDWLYRVCEKYQVHNLKDILYTYRQNGNPYIKYPHKSNIEKFGLVLLTEAHLRRKNGLDDFFEKKQLLEIRKFISLIQIKKGDQYFLKEELHLATSYYLKALSIFPLSIYSIKMLLKCLSKRI